MELCKSQGQTGCTSAALSVTWLFLRALKRVHRGQGEGDQHATWKQAPQVEHRVTLPSCHGKITSWEGHSSQTNPRPWHNWNGMNININFSFNIILTMFFVLLRVRNQVPQEKQVLLLSVFFSGDMQQYTAPLFLIINLHSWEIITYQSIYCLF
jgi:hypothetical protein